MKPQEKSSSLPAAAASPPPPVMKGTLSYDAGSETPFDSWNGIHEHSTVFPPQRFELLRNPVQARIGTLPSDGEFHALSA
jgi:hypothetical protein